MEVSGKPKPDTKITLYNVNWDGTLGTIIATHDDISSTNKFSKITQNLAFGYYAIKIENKITNTSLDGSKGHYYIRVDDCFDKSNMQMTGTEYFCTTETYSLTNIPNMALTSWSVAPSGLVSITPSGSSCTMTRTGTLNGYVTLTATVNKCGEGFPFTKKIYVGTPTPVNNIVPIAAGGGKLKPNTVYPFTPLPNVPPTEYGITQYEWQVVTGGTVYGSTHSNLYGQIKTDALATGENDKPITVRFRWKGCNWSDWVYYSSYITRIGGKDPLTPNFLVLPNPSSNEISFALESSESSSSTVNARVGEISEEDNPSKNIQWIRILDIAGNLKVDYQRTTSIKDLSTIKFDVSSWQPGMYIAYIYDGVELKTSTFVVNH